MVTLASPRTTACGCAGLENQKGGLKRRFTLLKELRRRDPNVKIIFVSGYAEEAFAKNLPSQEQYAFLAKPFTLKQLVAVVKQTLAG